MKETKFKNTEIGRIPDDWEVYPLSSLVSDIADGPFGSNLKTEHYISEKEVRVVQLSNIGDDGWHDSNTKYTSFAHSSTLSRCIIPTGSILIAKMMPAGRAIICPNIDSQYILGSDVVRITCDTKLGPKYFVYNTKSKLYLEQISECTQGSTRQRTSISKLKTIQIVVPPTREQDSIASALTSIDNLISSLGKLIEKKKDIKKGAMQQLLTGKIRLKGFSEPWVKRKLGDNATIQRGGSPRPIEAYLTTNRDGINWIKIGDVRPNDKFIRHTVEKIIPEGISHSRQVYKGDFILSNSMSFGRPYILDIDGCIHDGWLVIKDYSNTYDMDFLYYILSSDTVFEQYIAMAAGSSVKNLNKEKVANVMLFAPQSLAEQRAIATILNKMDNEITALETKKAKYEAIKQGMMQQLLTGKIRLIS